MSEPASGPAGSAQPRSKRAQVARACEWCRKHRIKCDNEIPCANCRRRGGGCSNNVNQAATLPVAHREIERLRSRVQKLEAELQQERRRQALPTPAFGLSPPELSTSESMDGDGQGRAWGGIYMRTARSTHKTWYGPSSNFYFIGRINAFLNAMLQQTQAEDQMLPEDSSRRVHGPGTEPEPRGQHMQNPKDSLANGEYLSPMQEEYFLDLFWQSYHTTLFPILDETEFKHHYKSLWTAGGSSRKPSALVDIVVAMCMQFGLSALPDVKSTMGTDGSENGIAGRWHYRRCQTLLGYELESPSISTLQCHLLCCIYLCCGSFQNMADSACSLAVRVAYMLGLHLEPPLTMAVQEREIRKRLWWALYVLDSKIGMKLGRPFLLSRAASVTPSLPLDTLEVALHSGSSFSPLGGNRTWLTFNIYHAKLFSTAREIHSAFYERGPGIRDGQTLWDDSYILAAYASFATAQLHQLDDWTKQVPDELRNRRNSPGVSFSTDKTPLLIEPLAPLWLQRQRLLLELMYHHLRVNLTRPFISFGPAQAEAARGLATMCALHAIALSTILQQVLSTSSILNGWHEAFQLQWNSSITLVGFVLANPQSQCALAARTAIDLCISNFDMFSASFAVATSAANIIRGLAAKIDFLRTTDLSLQHNAAINNINEPDVPQPDQYMALKTWEGALSFDDLNSVSMQDVFNVAFAVDEWSNLDSLWPMQNV